MSESEKKKKVVKVCLHSGKSVQMSLQFDDFFRNIFLQSSDFAILSNFIIFKKIEFVLF